MAFVAGSAKTEGLRWRRTSGPGVRGLFCRETAPLQRPIVHATVAQTEEQRQLAGDLLIDAGGVPFVVPAGVVEESDIDDDAEGSLKAALELMARRLLQKKAKQHTGISVQNWSLDVDTRQRPWRVTRAEFDSGRI